MKNIAFSSRLPQNMYSTMPMMRGNNAGGGGQMNNGQMNNGRFEHEADGLKRGKLSHLQSEVKVSTRHLS